MWRQLVETNTSQHKFHAPISKDAISAAEADLKVQFPKELSDLLFESNGVQGEYGLGLVWPLERIRSDNLSFRSKSTFKDLYMPFDNLLFIADAGNGDQFAYSICNGVIRRSDIFVWNHENDSRTWV